jgi:hypothetical protein
MFTSLFYAPCLFPAILGGPSSLIPVPYTKRSSFSESLSSPSLTSFSLFSTKIYKTKGLSVFKA